MQNNHVELLGPANSADTYQLRDFMQRSDIPLHRTELACDEEAQKATGLPSLQAFGSSTHVHGNQHSWCLRGG